MGYKLQTLVVILVMLASLLAPVLQPVKAATSNDLIVANITPLWTTGIISDDAGLARIIVDDLNQDGTYEVVTCSNGHVYVLVLKPANGYDTIWYGEDISCRRIATADRDTNGLREIYVATDDLRVMIYNANDFQLIGSMTAPGISLINDIAVANVDGDAELEIVLVRNVDTLVYNANTLSLEWQAADLGGKQVEIGNIDNDSTLEIVVNSSPAHILSASTKTQKWSFSGGFGISMDIGDVDGDNRAEIAYVENWNNAVVIDGDTQTWKWSHGNLADLDIVKLYDIDGDGKCEVIIGDGQWGKVMGYRGSDGEKLWSINNPNSGVVGIGAGDANNDGVIEILWGAGVSSSSTGALITGSWVNQTVEWICEDLDGPLYTAVGDVDNDSQNEIVMASLGTNEGYGIGVLRVYDGATKQLEWSAPMGTITIKIYHLAIGQLDSDAALEIVVGGKALYNTRLQVIDGISHAVEWQSPVMSSNETRVLKVMNLDSDNLDEIIVGLNNNHIQILNGASSFIQWDSGGLDGLIQDVSVGDLDGNAVLDLAVLTTRSVYVYEVGTWTVKLFTRVSGGQKLAILNTDQTGTGKLAVVYSDSSSNHTLEAWDGKTYAVLLQRSLGKIMLKNIFVADLDTDGSQEFILMGYNGLVSHSPSLFWIGNLSYPFLWEYKMTGRYWDPINSLVLSDVDKNGKVELVIGSGGLIQVNEFTTSSPVIHETYLPVTYNKQYPRGPYGTVTENGNPVSNIPIQLRFFNGTSWSTIAIKNTATNGTYAFGYVPSLKPGQYYYVFFQNSANGNPDRLWFWHTRYLESFTIGTEVHIGDFDLTNIALTTPINGATISLPYLFQWGRRPNSPTDSYELDIYDPMDGEPWFYTQPLLGYVTGYQLNSLPLDFETGKLFAWEVWVFSPDGGFGISYYSRAMFFSNTGLASPPDRQPVKSNIFPDLENRLQR